jgi:hypothetical protein
MSPIYEYLIAALILAGAVSFALVISARPVTVAAEQAAIEAVHRKANAVADFLVGTTGSPSNWGGLGSTPDTLGLGSSAESPPPLVLDRDKLRRFLRANDSGLCGTLCVPEVQDRLNLGEFELEVRAVPTYSLTIWNYSAQGNATLYELAVQDWKGSYLPQGAVRGFYLDPSWTPNSSTDPCQAVDAYNATQTLTFTDAYGRARLYVDPSCASTFNPGGIFVASVTLGGGTATNQTDLGTGGAWFRVVAGRVLPYAGTPLWRDAALAMSTLPGGVQGVTVFRVVEVDDTSYQLIVTLRTRTVAI